MRPADSIAAQVRPPDPVDAGQSPDAVRLTVPAHLSFLATIRAAVSAIVGEFGGVEDDRDLQLAADEVASVLIEESRPWTVVQLSVAQDDTDIYVRIVTRRAQLGRRLVIPKLTQLLLDSAVESYEVFGEGRWGYGILQTSKAGRGSSS